MYFNTETSCMSDRETEADDRKRPDIRAQVAFKGDFTDEDADE